MTEEPVMLDEDWEEKVCPWSNDVSIDYRDRASVANFEKWDWFRHIDISMIPELGLPMDDEDDD